MGVYPDLCCRNEELLKKLGAHPARRVRLDLSFPCWEVPKGSIVVNVGYELWAWPLISDEIKDVNTRRT